MKKLVLTALLAIPFVVQAQRTVLFDQAFNSNVSSRLADYKLTSAGGSPIEDSNNTRFDSFGATTPPAGIAYSVDAAGLKISRTSGSSQVMAQVKGLTNPSGTSADLAFVQFDLSVSTNTALTPSSSTPLFVFAGQGFGSNSNTDDHATNAYMSLAFYYPNANSTDFGIKVGSTAVGSTYSNLQKITWVINRTAGTVSYIGPDGSSSSVGPASYEVWVGTSKVDLSGATITPTVAGKPITDFRFRNGATWVGYTAFKNVKIGYLKTDGTGDVSDAANLAFNQVFDNNVSSTVADYRAFKNAGNVPLGTVGGPIADAARLNSIPNPSVLTAGFYNSVDADGFKFNRTNSDIRQTAHIGGLTIPDNGVAFAEFDMTVNANTNNGTYTPIVLYLGAGYANSSNDEGTKHFQSIGFKFPSANSFYLTSDAGQTAFTGTKKILWVVNRSADAVSYTGPDNSTNNLTANGGYNIWVEGVRLMAGGVPVGENATPGNAAPQIKDFRMRATTAWSSNSSIAFKNMKVGYMDFQVLPVKLSSFTAKANGSSVNLKWQSASETNFAHYDVTRSTDGANFVKIGERAAKGASTYLYTDFAPAKGNNYYQLISQDNDGKSEKSAVVVANLAASALDVTIEGVSAQGLDLGVSVQNAGKASITLSNISGKVIASSDVVLAKGYNRVSLATAYKGLVIAKVTTADASVSKKTVK